MKTREELLNQLGQLEGYFDELEIFQVLAKDYSADAVDRILSAPTQKQLDCPYCHEPFLDLSGQSVDEMFPEDAYCNFEKDGLNYGSGEFEDGSDKTIHVNFCPMCGRKLGDE